ncbi:MAG: phage tail protein [Mycobacterium sp.]|jgi:phage tail-like protein|nr:phage tail protein [Mycobacterium sp.]
MIDGLDSALPLALQLPAVYQEDEFTQRLVSAFDAVLAPVLATLDDLPVYLDPRLAPDDFVGWLAGWVGAELEHATTPAARREIVATAVSLHRRRGTVGGIEDVVRLAASGDVAVTESGGARWARAPGSAFPGEAPASLRVRVTVADPAGVDVRLLDALIAAVKPAHVLHTVEVVAS